jgi:hypothetical protein
MDERTIILAARSSIVSNRERRVYNVYMFDDTGRVGPNATIRDCSLRVHKYWERGNVRMQINLSVDQSTGVESSGDSLTRGRSGCLAVTVPVALS